MSPAWAIWLLRRMPAVFPKRSHVRCEAARAHVMPERPAKAELIRTAGAAVQHLRDAVFVLCQHLAQTLIVT